MQTLKTKELIEAILECWKEHEVAFGVSPMEIQLPMPKELRILGVDIKFHFGDTIYSRSEQGIMNHTNKEFYNRNKTNQEEIIHAQTIRDQNNDEDTIRELTGRHLPGGIRQGEPRIRE